MGRILVIEDDPTVAEALQHLLVSAGHEITWVPNGRPALKRHAQEAFDLVVSDIIMPDMEGIETIRALRRAQADIPIIAISGGSSLDANYLLRLASEFGSTATFSKPLRREPFLAKVSELLEANGAA